MKSDKIVWDQNCQIWFEKIFQNLIFILTNFKRKFQQKGNYCHILPLQTSIVPIGRLKTLISLIISSLQSLKIIKNHFSSDNPFRRKIFACQDIQSFLKYFFDSVHHVVILLYICLFWRILSFNLKKFIRVAFFLMGCSRERKKVLEKANCNFIYEEDTLDIWRFDFATDLIYKRILHCCICHRGWFCPQRSDSQEPYFTVIFKECFPSKKSGDFVRSQLWLLSDFQNSRFLSKDIRFSVRDDLQKIQI